MQVARASNSQDTPKVLESHTANFDILPEELRQLIFYKAADQDIKTMFRLTATCTDWRTLSLDPSVISHLFAETLPQAVENYKQTGRQSDLLFSLATDARMSSAVSKPKQFKWEQQEDKKGIYSLATHNKLLYCATFNENLKIFNAETGDLLDQCSVKEMMIKAGLQSTDEIIMSLKVIEDKLFIGLNHSKAIIWDLKENKKDFISLGQLDPTMQIDTYQNKTILSTMDTGINILDNLEKDSSVISLGAKSVGPFCLNGETIITGNYLNGEICFWNMAGKELDQFIANDAGIKSLAIHKGKLITGAMNGLIQIWDLNTKKELGRMLGDDEISALKVVANKIISSSLENKICIWDFEGHLLKEFECSEDLRSTDFSDGRIYIGCTNGQIEVIDFNPENNKS